MEGEGVVCQKKNRNWTNKIWKLKCGCSQLFEITMVAIAAFFRKAPDIIDADGYNKRLRRSKHIPKLLSSYFLYWFCGFGIRGEIEKYEKINLRYLHIWTFRGHAMKTHHRHYNIMSVMDYITIESKSQSQSVDSKDEQDCEVHWIVRHLVAY